MKRRRLSDAAVPLAVGAYAPPVVQTDRVNGWPPPRARLDWEPLLTLEASIATRAICRDPDGSLWLVHDLENPEAGGDWYPEEWEEDFDWREEFGEPLVNDEVAGLSTAINGIGAIGGRLPAGVTSVEVRDEAREFETAVGDGLWIAAVADAHRQDPIVVFRRKDDSVVAVPSAGELAREGRLDSDATCPACGEQSWSVWSADSERVARCDECGLRVELPEAGPMQHIVITCDPSKEGSRDEVIRENWAAIVAGLGRPPLGLDSRWTGERRLAGWGGSGPDAPVQSVTLDHGDRRIGQPGPWVYVTTGRQQFDRYFTAEEWLSELLAGERRHQNEYKLGLARDDANELATALAERRELASARALQAFKLDVPVDGVAVGFTAIGDENLWCACGRHHDFSITIAAKGTPQGDILLSSAVVDDYLDPPEPQEV